MERRSVYLDYVGKDTFYGLLASLRGQLFGDDDFAEIYCPDNGRDSVRRRLLGDIVAYSDRLLELARQAQETRPEDSAEREGIVAAAELLRQLLLQDVKSGADGDGGAVT